MSEQSEGQADDSVSAIICRGPTARDGAAVWRLIAACPPLDTNSLYCNLLQCTHFADTCVLAERDGEPCGWISAYRPPNDPSALFVWQVAVHQSARGHGLARKMLRHLLTRPAARGVERIQTTITPSNAASWAMFRGFATTHGLGFTDDLLFDSAAHFGGAHESEHLVTIGPFDAARLAA